MLKFDTTKNQKMKAVKLLLILTVSLTFSCQRTNQIKEELIIVGSPNQKSPDPGDERHRPDGSDKANNYFDLKEMTLNLKIPLTNNNLRMNRDYIVNISSKNYSAVFINLGGNHGFPTDTLPIRGYLRCKIPFERIKGKPLDTTKLRRDGKLIVYVIHDDNPSCLLPYFKNCVQHLSDYIWIGCDIEGVCKFKDEEPKEQNGDVIGGNQ